MTECQIHGCLYLRTHCATCGRVVCEKILPKAQEWISVKDRQPEVHEDVLVCLNHYIYVAFRLPNEFIKDVPWAETFSRRHLDYPPTHWMPLPEPLK